LYFQIIARLLSSTANIRGMNEMGHTITTYKLLSLELVQDVSH